MKLPEGVRCSLGLALFLALAGKVHRPRATAAAQALHRGVYFLPPAHWGPPPWECGSGWIIGSTFPGVALFCLKRPGAALCSSKPNCVASLALDPLMWHSLAQDSLVRRFVA
ncbi:hypothetical protein NDU88_000926 [Pleurodeles waltl]|uniref:Secreted protein n=1 Tax=Pleurodeles waltl TaxID=8319 RepID=A0AAV7N9D4_PLEWA|nr:hypothetical protein NDU88_000926 [Pleurodeles waltl]